MLTLVRSISLVLRKFKISPNKLGSLSIKIAPVSSLTVGIRPLSKAVKNVSGTHVKVCQDVANLKKSRS